MLLRSYGSVFTLLSDQIISALFVLLHSSRHIFAFLQKVNLCVVDYPIYGQSYLGSTLSVTLSHAKVACKFVDYLPSTACTVPNGLYRQILV